MDWRELYPEFATEGGVKSQVQFADIGCGYGGLLGRNSQSTAPFFLSRLKKNRFHIFFIIYKIVNFWEC